jgi:hypothetical protein
VFECPTSGFLASFSQFAKTDETEDFMEAFHGFEEFEMNHQPERRKGRPETRSTHHSRTSSASASANVCML